VALGGEGEKEGGGDELVMIFKPTTESISI